MPRKSSNETPRPVRLFLLDDHPVLRLGLGRFLTQEGFQIVGEAADENEILESLERTAPEILIADISLGRRDATPTIALVSEKRPQTPVLVFSMHEDPFHVQRVLNAGARGFVNKQEATDLLVAAIKKVHAGNTFLSPRIKELLESIRDGRTCDIPPQLFSPKESEVYDLLGRGFAPREIAGNLEVSIKTVETHFARIRKKLGLSNSRELARHAIENHQKSL